MIFIIRRFEEQLIEVIKKSKTNKQNLIGLSQNILHLTQFYKEQIQKTEMSNLYFQHYFQLVTSFFAFSFMH